MCDLDQEFNTAMQILSVILRCVWQVSSYLGVNPDPLCNTLFWNMCVSLCSSIGNVVGCSIYSAQLSVCPCISDHSYIRQDNSVARTPSAPFSTACAILLSFAHTYTGLSAHGGAYRDKFNINSTCAKKKNKIKMKPNHSKDNIINSLLIYWLTPTINLT